MQKVCRPGTRIGTFGSRKDPTKYVYKKEKNSESEGEREKKRNKRKEGEK